MATPSGNTAVHATLTAASADTVTLNSPLNGVEIKNHGGGQIYFRVDGTPPVVGANDNEVIDSGESVVLPNYGPIVVGLISSAGVAYSVTAVLATSYSRRGGAGVLMPQNYTPPSGGWQYPNGYMSVTPAAVVSGRASFVAVDVGPKSLTLQSLGCSVSTAQVGGTAVTQLGLYADDGSGGLPDFSKQLAVGTITPTSTGKKPAAVSLTLPPGRYWAAHLYVATVAPSTAPQFSSLSSASAGQGMWTSDANFLLSGLARGVFLAGLSALPTTAQSGADTQATLAVVVALRAA